MCAADKVADLGIARTIVTRPEVVLYDEPTTGLDPINTQRIAHVIAGLNRALGVTSIVVTHDMKTAFSLADRLALIEHGEVIVTGTPAEFEASTDPRVANFIRGVAPADEDVAMLVGA